MVQSIRRQRSAELRKMTSQILLNRHCQTFIGKPGIPAATDTRSDAVPDVATARSR